MEDLYLQPWQTKRKRFKTGLVYGVGINDSLYQTHRHEFINGKSRTVETCPYYATWTGMLRRAYCPRYKMEHPTYEIVEVCEDWLFFTRFKSWMVTQIWEDLQLDKDILFPANKVYSPETCVFIPQQINKALTGTSKSRSDTPFGVNHDHQTDGYQAWGPSGVSGKRKFLGRFVCKMQAHKAWQKCKLKTLNELLTWYREKDYYLESVDISITKRCEMLKDDMLQNKETLDLNAAAELSLKADARIDELEYSLHWILTGFKNVLESKPVRDADEIICHIEKLLEGK